MSILWRTVFFSRCTSTHHKLALDALRFVRGPQSDLWTNLFLSNHEQYLTGSKAPDNEFKDFKNHVLHVKDGFWGGALAAAREWYQKTVTALSQGDWPEACYNAGVLSHYFTDPFQPFHTGQTEAEGKVHRAAEWSICKSYEMLQAILEQDLQGYPQYELPTRPDWLEEAIRQGALTAHDSYTVCIEHYDLNRGIKDPPSGLDQEMKDRLAQLIGLASVGFSRVLERAFEDSGASPPDVAVSLHVLLATLKVPLNWIRKKFTDLHERAVIEAIYLEIQDQGKVIEALPEDERLVRKQYAQEVLKVPVRQLDAQPAGPTGTQYGSGTPSRGETVKAASTASFQRTVVSNPRAHETLRGPVAPLETCLMVPLAKEPPPDIVADVAVRAYLRNQAPPEPPVSTSIGSNAPDLQVGARQNSRSEASEVVANAKPTIADPPAPSKAELDKAARRLQRQLERQRDPEPALVPPPAAPLMFTESAALPTTEMPQEMFAPLPAMPKSAGRDPQNPASTLSPAAVPGTTVAHSAAAPAAGARQSATAPARTSPTITTPPSSATNTPVRPAPPAAKHGGVIPQGSPVAVTREGRTFSVEPAEASTVPAPHVRIPEPVPDAAPAQAKNRITTEGQSAGFDFRNFSGLNPAQNSGVLPAALPGQPAGQHVSPVAASLPQPGAVVTPTPIRPIASQPAAAANQPVQQIKPAAVSLPIAASQPTNTSVPPPAAVRPPAPLLSTSRRFYLELSQPVVDAPSIGPKTAERLQLVGIHTIADLLQANAGDIAEKLGNRAATDLVKDWQDQARLVCNVPNMRGHDAQFLVACQVRTAEQLRSREPQQLLQQVTTFLRTNAGQRLLRGGTPPDLAEATSWITCARDARSV